MRHGTLLPASLAAAALLSPAGQARAASPDAWSQNDQAAASACAKASGLRDAQVDRAPIRFSDEVGIDARLVTGTWPQAHMAGRPARMLCLYDRSARQAEVQDAQPWAPQLADSDAPGRGDADARPRAPAPPFKDTQWIAEEIGGRGVLAGSRVTAMFDSGGKVGGNSGCNGYSANYSVQGRDLQVFAPFVGTRMACPPPLLEQEARFQTLLADAQGYGVDADGALIVTSRGGRLRFVAEVAAAPEPEEAGRPASETWTLLCAGERMRVAFYDDRAAIDFDDGQRQEIPRDRGGPDPDWRRVFTNGRITVIQTLEGPDAGAAFARGRMAPQRCQVVEDR